MSAVLGIDTSCYTTSAALVSVEGELLGSARRLLTVGEGERGLQQSQGLFQHVKNLPDMIGQVMQGAPQICAVCASVRPRPAEESYMPVFRAGESQARAAAALLRVPFYPVSHQEGHIRAALVDSGVDAQQPFLALHLSGGTTEVVTVDAGAIALAGGSNDLHAGQFIDRVGVRLGLPFPAGPALETMARRGNAEARLPIWVRGGVCSFSGSESAAQRMIDVDALSADDMAAEVFSCVARTVAKMIVNAAHEREIHPVLLAGGVASSTLLRELVEKRVKKQDARVRLYWGRPELSGDNACGPALIGWERIHS